MKHVNPPQKKKRVLWLLRALTLSRNNLRNAPAGPGWYLSNTYSQRCTLWDKGDTTIRVQDKWGHRFHSTGKGGTLVSQHRQCRDTSVITPSRRWCWPSHQGATSTACQTSNPLMHSLMRYRIAVFTPHIFVAEKMNESSPGQGDRHHPKGPVP